MLMPRLDSKLPEVPMSNQSPLATQINNATGVTGRPPTPIPLSAQGVEAAIPKSIEAAKPNFTMSPNYEGSIPPGKQMAPTAQPGKSLALTEQGVFKAAPKGFTGPTSQYQGFSAAERANAEGFKAEAAERVNAARNAANNAATQQPTVNNAVAPKAAGGLLSRALNGLSSVGAIQTQIADQVLNSPQNAQMRDNAIAGLKEKAGLAPDSKPFAFLGEAGSQPTAEKATTQGTLPANTPAVGAAQPEFKMPNMLTGDNIKQAPSLNGLATSQRPVQVPATTKVDLGNGNYIDAGKAINPESAARMQSAMTPSTPEQLAKRAESAALADQRYQDLKNRQAANNAGTPATAQQSGGPDYSGIIDQALQTLDSKRPTNSFDDAIAWKHKTANAKAVLDQVGGMQQGANSNKSNENINANNTNQRQKELDQQAKQNNVQNEFEKRKIDLGQSNLKSANESNALEKAYQRTKDTETAKREQARLDLAERKEASTPKKYTLPSGESFNGTEAQFQTQVKYEGRATDPSYKKMVEVHGPEAADAGYLEYLQTPNN